MASSLASSSSVRLALRRAVVSGGDVSRHQLGHRFISTRPTRMTREEQARYLVIREFFSSYAKQRTTSISSQARRLTTSSIIRSERHDAPNDKEAQTDQAKPQSEHDNAARSTDHEWPSSGHQPFHNYPRGLRELALQARRRGRSPLTEEEIRSALERGEGGFVDHASNDLANVAHTSTSSSQDPSNEQKSDSPAGQGQAKPSPSRWTRPRPPSKEELLHIAQGFWTRLRIRFKWFTIRGFRRFNADDLSAFFTLGGLGTVVFIVVGTTTAVSLVFAALNALNMQEWIARKLADYLTAETGVTVIFESAIVPKWKDSRICFQNVFISRRAYANDAETLRKERDWQGNVDSRRRRQASRRGRGTASTAGQGMAWEGTHFNEYDEEEVAPPMSDAARGQDADQVDDGRQTNFSMFDLNVDNIDVKLSFSRWWDGKGLVEDAVVEGVRGIIDRRNVFWDPDKPYDPRAARREGKHGDFQLDSLTIKDFLVTVYQPGSFRPFNLSVFEAQMPRLRKQWLFYDLLGADRITGQVDGCLFSLHKPQSIGRTNGREREILTGRWKTLSRLRIDGINFDHIQNQSDVHGPVSWILSGKFDVVADIKLPKEASSDIDINVIISEMLDHISQAVNAPETRGDGPIPGQHRLSVPAIEAPVTTVGPASEGAWKQKERELNSLRAKSNSKWRSEMEMAAREASMNRGSGKSGDALVRRERESGVVAVDAPDSTSLDSSSTVAADYNGDGAPLDGQVSSSAAESTSSDDVLKAPSSTGSVVIDMDVRFKDIKAAVPLFSSDLTYRTQTFVRPIVAFMNANHTLIPVHCRVVMDLSEFDGAMDLAQTGLLPIVSEKIYDALANHVQSQAANGRRIRSVSQWWLRLATDQLLQYAMLIRDTMARNRTGLEAVDPSHLALSESSEMHRRTTS